jgi:hypothetical protein
MSWSDGVDARLYVPWDGPNPFARFEEILRRRDTLLINQHIFYDLGILCAERPHLLPLVFEALEAGRIRCVKVREQLIRIARGEAKFLDVADDEEPDEDVVATKTRFDLAAIAKRWLGIDVKKEGTWRKSYALLYGIPVARWPSDAVEYPLTDAQVPLRVWAKQEEYIREAFVNFGGVLPGEIEANCAAWALHLMKCWGVRTCPEAVAKLTREMEIRVLWTRIGLLMSGILRKSGTRLKPKAVETKAETQRRVVEAFTARGEDVPFTKPSKMFPDGQVKASKKVLEDTKDVTLIALAEHKGYVKILSTYIPRYVAKGVEVPINADWNPLVESFRISCSRPNLTNPPRAGKVRECFIARTVFVSADFDQAELRSWAQVCLKMFGYSKMAEAFRDGVDPHLKLGAELLGLSLEEGTRLYGEGDKKVEESRQFAKCFHPDTEILTRRRGWVSITSLTMDDEVASVVPRDYIDRRDRPRDEFGRFPKGERINPANTMLPSMEIIWCRPERLTRRPAETLLHIRNEGINLRVTDDHRMLAYGGTKALKVVEAKDFGKQRGWFNAGLFKDGMIEVDERLLRLAVAAQADGNYIVRGVTQPKIRFGFSKKRKIDRLVSLLLPGEYERKLYANGKNQPTTNFLLTESFSSEIKRLLDLDKTIPWWWMDLSSRLREVVLDEVAYWDASWTGGSRRSTYFYTAIKKNAEVLQAIAVITNRKATYLKEKDDYVVEHENGEIEYKTPYVLSIKRKYDTRGENVQKTVIPHSGDVVCLSVPSSFVLVRDKGIPVICGQCPNFGLIGGMGANKFVEHAAKSGFVLTKREATDKISTWKKTWPEAKEYLAYFAKNFEQRGVIVHPITGFVRGDVGYSDAANHLFQHLTAIGAKQALWDLTKECFLDTTSPLFGAHPVIHMHDEIFGELTADSRLWHVGAMRWGQVMQKAMEKWIRDVPIKCTPVLTRRLYKGAKPVFINGELVPSKPAKIDGKTKWVADLVENVEGKAA